MTATRLGMIGCIGFAGLSAYLAANAMGIGLNEYAGDLHCRFIAAQRDVLFKLIPALQPPLQADQIEAAADAAKLSVDRRTAGSIQLTSGVDFDLQGTAVRGVRSINF